MNTRVTVIVDRYRLREQQTWPIKPGMEAQQLKALARVMGTPNLFAIVHEADGAARQAYLAQGYEVHTMNGDRPQVLPQVLEQIIPRESDGNVVIVSDDPAFAPFIEEAQRRNLHVHLWTPGQAPALVTSAPVDVRPLAEMIPDLQSSACVWLDIENVIYGLVEHGRRPDTALLVEAIKGLVEQPIQEMYAYGDFSRLRETLGRDIQREVEELGVRTIYLINRRGKNSADMRMASDIQTALMNGEAPETIIIASGDRDFEPLIEQIHAHGKRVILLACRGTLSRDLERLADHVYYLDNHLPLSKDIQPQATQADKVYLLKFLAHLKQNTWKWAFRHKLPEALRTPELEHCCTIGALLEDGDKIRPNYGHPLVRAADCLRWWLPDRIRYLLEVKGMPYVDTKYLARGMALDKACHEAGVGQTFEDAREWLNAAADAGLVVRKIMPHPRTPEQSITTWALF